MNVTCSDRERIFEDGTPAEWAALEEHAVSCPLCAEESRGWKSLSVAAKELREYSERPSFSPRLANYHEKLLVLDSAIAELRAQAGLNPSNAQLRYQLLAMYQEKQRTLEEVLEVKP